MNITSITRAAGALTITAGLAFAMTVPAQASHGGGGKGVQAHGKCSMGSNWKLKAKTDDGRIEVEAEIDTNKTGQVWNWKIDDNGTVAAQGASTTKGRSGSFSVERKVPNQAGADKFVLTASTDSTGETCTGSVTL